MNRNFKKVLSMVMVLMMIVSTMMIVPLTTHAEEEPFAGVAINGITGMGTEAAPYLAATKADLDAIAAVANAADAEGVVGFRTRKCYLNLTADINIGGGSWGLNKNSYPSSANDGAVMWQIDGQGHTISNTNTQIIYGVAGGVTIKNLNVVMSQNNAEANGAALIGLAYTTLGPVVIENCTVSGTMNFTRGAGRHAGGFIACVSTGPEAVTIKNCVNNATISSANGHNMGGFIGTVEATATSTVNIENSLNNGAVTNPKHNGGFVGAYNNGKLNIKNSVNAGAIKSTATGTSDAATAGGFVGMQGDAAPALTIENCVNTGTITSANGIAAAFAAHVKSGYASFTNCYDAGSVSKPLFGTNNDATAKVTNTATLQETLEKITLARTGVAALSATAWDGTTVTEPALETPGEANSATNPYLVGTAAELAWFSNHNATKVSASYWLKLTADINLGGIAWKGLVSASGVEVNIDGDHYTVYNGRLEEYVKGFIVYAKANVTISNLHFVKMISNKTGSTGGVVIGAVNAGTTTLTNITVSASCTMAVEAGTSTTGGLIGGHDGGSIVIDKCISAASISQSGTPTASYSATDGPKGNRLGGLVGTGRNINISNSISEAGMAQYVTGTNQTGAIVGLVVDTETATFTNVFCSSSFANHSFRYQQATVQNCYAPFELTNSANAAAVAAVAAIAAAVPHLYTDACDTACDVPYCATTRVAPHVYTDDCDAECNAEGCGETRTPAHYLDSPCDPMCDKCGYETGLTHQYTDDCDASCNVDGCGFVDPQRGHDWEFACTLDCSRCGADNPDVVPHDYESNCDSACFYCGEDLRTAPHTWAGDCDTVCEDCDHTREGNGEHTYYGTCDTTCNVCGFVREAGEHVYDNACDATCNVTDCGFERTAPHVWASDCDTICEECDATREGDGNHTYTDACDADCNVCGFEREAPHVYDEGGCDAECNVCGATRAVDAAHSWTNECDTECNACGFEREAPHVWSSDCDTTCNNDCGATREGDGNHTYHGTCDTTCNECGATREAGAHVYDNDCDATCNVTECGFERAVPDHVYHGTCDTTCNECGATREAGAHVYDSACDTTCNVTDCGNVREVPAHVYTNECDAECDVDGCTYTRVAPHKYSGDCDIACDNDGCTHTRAVMDAHTFAGACDTDCNVCGATRAAGEHTYTNECDAKCDVDGCTAEDRVPPHKFSSDCDGACDNAGCTHTRVTTAAHAYDNACDTACNACGATRAAEHVYTNACDGTCNTEGCTGVRAPSAHVYDDDKDATCNVCGAERQIEAEDVTPVPDTTTKAPETTTAAPETTTAAPEEEEKGCKGAMDSTYAVLALVAVLGFAFVAKKREEN